MDPKPTHQRATASLLERVAGLVPIMQSRGSATDSEPGFPFDDIAALREIGVLAAPVGTALGGLGLGTEPPGVSGVTQLLRLLGAGNLSVGRLFEAHVNALRLVEIYGTPDQRRRVAQDVQDGHLFGLWVTDGPGGVRLDVQHLRGQKSFCSGAGFLTRALLTAQTPQGDTVMVMMPIDPGEHRVSHSVVPQGMRAAMTGAMDFDGLAVPPDAVIGSADDYLREPEFSAGAWRGSAVALGGLEAMAAETRRQLVRRGRHRDPHQVARMGHVLIAQETAAMWVHRAARMAESGHTTPQERHAYVNLARIAVEKACLEAIPLIQRSLGLAAFVPPNPVERMMRDLATYLRQPAPDEALADATGYYMEHGLPPEISPPG